MAVQRFGLSVTLLDAAARDPKIIYGVPLILIFSYTVCVLALHDPAPVLARIDA